MPSDAEVLGQELRKAREARDLTLDQVEQQTRIRAKYLEALEQGTYDLLPTAVQARGFLRNYARFLNLDADDMMARYDALQGGRRRGRKSKVMARPSGYTTYAGSTQRRPNNVIGRVLIGGIVLILLVGAAIAGALQLQSMRGAGNSDVPQNTPTQAVPSQAAATEPATPLRPTPLPGPATVAPTNTTGPGPVNPAGGVAVSLQIKERTWLRVWVDGSEKYTGAPGPNTVLQYTGGQVRVHIGNAAGVDAIVNNRDLGIMGARGQIVDQTFTVGGATFTAPSPPAPTANSPGAAKLPTQPPTIQFARTSPGATFSLTATVALPSRTNAATASRTTIPPTDSPTKRSAATLTPSALPSSTATPSATRTPTNTTTPSATPTASLTLTATTTLTPSQTLTATATLTPTNTVFFLPRDTSTPEGGEIRPK